MNLRGLNLSALIVCLWSILLLAACSTDNEALGIVDDAEGVTVHIVLSMGQPAGASRATLSPDANAPSDDIVSMGGDIPCDYYVNPWDLDVLLFSRPTGGDVTQGTFVGRATGVYVFNATTGGGTDVACSYYLTAMLNTLDEDDLDKDYQVVVVGNLGTKADGQLFTTIVGNDDAHQTYTRAYEGDGLVTGVTTLGDYVASLTYHGYTAAFTQALTATENDTDKKARIPMWGIRSSIITKGTNSLTLYLLRAMAKVRVSLDKNLLDSYSLTGVTLSHANPSGYLAAQGGQAVTTATDGTITTSYNNDREAPAITSPSVPAPATISDDTEAVLTSLPFVETDRIDHSTGQVMQREVTTTDAEGNPITIKENLKSFVIYVPEYLNIDPATGHVVAHPAVMSLAVTKKSSGQSRSYPLYFAKYEGGTANATQWDILRNDFYDYTVTRIIEPTPPTPTGSLQANVRVMPWDYRTMEYELSQNARVMLLSEPQAVNNAGTDRAYANETAYSQGDADLSRYATFQIRVDQPKGVRWVAHLTDPYNFAFTDDSQTYGFGGTGEVATIRVKPRDPNGVGKTTQLFFTVETLIDVNPQIVPTRTDLDKRQHYAINDESNGIDIIQVKTKSVVDNGVVPFTVTETYDQSLQAGTLGLDYPDDVVTVNVYHPTSETVNAFSNGAVMAAYDGKLYCMWQNSNQQEDKPETYVAYHQIALSADQTLNAHTGPAPAYTGNPWQNGLDVLCPNKKYFGSDNDYCSSGGWLATEDGLVAYINTWNMKLPADGHYKGGVTRYLDNTLTWGADAQPVEVKMADGSVMNAIFEQDPHIITLPNGQKRIVCAAHFQDGDNGGLYVCPIYTDDLSGVAGWKKGDFAYTVNGGQSREMEPSLYQKANGTLVMVFRDNLQVGGVSSFRVLASYSTDYGQTWTKAVETAMRDSRAKLSAGNLPDGTAFIINCPVENKNRYPLVISLSRDGNDFGQAFVLRSGATTATWDGRQMQAKTYAGNGNGNVGYVYPKAMVHGDYLYVSYCTNKEDVEYTRIPLSSIQLNE